MTPRQANSIAAGPANAVGAEQAYVDVLYRLLDEARDRTERALTETLGTGEPGARSRPGSSVTSPRPSSHGGWRS